jgi:hypothetical protein
MELSYICLVTYVFVGLFAIETVAQSFMTYYNVTLIVINYIYIYIYILLLERLTFAQLVNIFFAFLKSKSKLKYDIIYDFTVFPRETVVHRVSVTFALPPIPILSGSPDFSESVRHPDVVSPGWCLLTDF